ncbi:MAG: cytochrome c [bacterium]
MIRFVCRISLLLFIFISMTGCRAWRSEKPALHVNPNLDWQAKFKAQKLAYKSPEGVVPWGTERSLFFTEERKDLLAEDSILYRGKTSSGLWVSKIPIPVNQKLLLKGQQQFNIYCAVCHTKTGDGSKSLISKRGWVIPNITEYSTRIKKDGELYSIVTHGIRSMPGYSYALNVEDRWAVVSYVRALQKASYGSYQRVPMKHRNQLK